MKHRYVFSKSGMTEEELLFYANNKSRFPRYTNAESEYYGHGMRLREYGFYPGCLPLNIQITHGPSQWDFVTQHMIQTSANYVGLFSQRLKSDLESRTTKKAYVIKSPFWYYRIKNNIKKNKSARGTIFFHSHSTYWANMETDFEKVFSELDRLPDHFKPISVCLHFVDVVYGRYKPYMERGYPVYTCGNMEGVYFIDNFFEIVKNFDFSVSNSLGSYAFYCTDFGLPFTLIDAEPIITENTDTNIIASGRVFNDHIQMQKCLKTFTGVNSSISGEQKQLTEEELGINNGLGRWQLAVVLYKTLIILYFNVIRRKASSVIASLMK